MTPAEYIKHLRSLRRSWGALMVVSVAAIGWSSAIPTTVVLGVNGLVWLLCLREVSASIRLCEEETSRKEHP